MGGLALHKDIKELTEETFQRLVGDYFATQDRIKEIGQRVEDYNDAKKKLSNLHAFESWSEYLSAKHAHDSYDEVLRPIIDRLEQEREDKRQQLRGLEESLLRLLPPGVWIRYGDKGIRVAYYNFISGEHIGAPRYKDSSDPKVIQIDEWSAIRPYSPMVARRKASNGVKEDSFTHWLLHNEDSVVVAIANRISYSYWEGLLSDKFVIPGMGSGLMGGPMLLAINYSVDSLLLFWVGSALLIIGLYYLVRFIAEIY